MTTTIDDRSTICFVGGTGVLLEDVSDGTSSLYHGARRGADRLTRLARSHSVKLFTIGYGGRTPTDFGALLRRHGVAALVDVRIDPTKAHLGSFVLAKAPDRGIRRLLGEAG